MHIFLLTNTLMGYIMILSQIPGQGILKNGFRSVLKDGMEIFMERSIEKNGEDHQNAACGCTPDDTASGAGFSCGQDSCRACHHKKTPRSETELKSLKNRLNRISGQLSGISRMLDDNRYCGDILTQVAAVESALQSFGYLILKEHMETCVVEEVQNGNTQIVEEAFELIRKLK